MAGHSLLLTLDSNVFLAALKGDEPYSDRCREILQRVPDDFILAEPSVVYQEVCGTLAGRVGVEVAREAERRLDLMIHPALLATVDRAFCVSAHPLCGRHGIYAIDALYLKVASDNHAILASLDREDFIERVRATGGEVEAYHLSEFPY